MPHLRDNARVAESAIDRLLEKIGRVNIPSGTASGAGSREIAQLKHEMMRMRRQMESTDPHLERMLR